MSSPIRPRVASFTQVRPGHQVYLENVQGGMLSLLYPLRYIVKVPSDVEEESSDSDARAHQVTYPCMRRIDTYQE